VTVGQCIADSIATGVMPGGMRSWTNLAYPALKRHLGEVAGEPGGGEGSDAAAPALHAP